MPASFRTTDSPLALPSVHRILLLGGRALRLSCPHCGEAPVLARCTSLRKWGSVRARCDACNFRFERSDDSYFSGAMLTNLLMSELLFAIGFLISVIALWPDVPWDFLTYAGAAGMVLTPALLYPVAKLLWLTIDVLVRPVMPNELT